MKRSELINELENRGYKVEEIAINKVNGKQGGLSVTKDGVGVVLYGGDYTAQEVIDMIEDKRNANLSDALVNRDYILSNVGFRLINAEKNREYLEGKPHVDLLDLTAVFEVDTTKLIGQPSSTVISESVLEHAGITRDELYAHAMENEKIVYDSLMNILFPAMESVEDADIIVATKENKYYGATAMLHTDILAKIAEIKGDDLIIFPSSVHEVILIPGSFSDNAEDMIGIVKQVNATEVRPEDFLSDNVYYFDRATKTVEFM